ncbi:hypothetical protein KC850_00815, partial [Candidatus Kaiserbacteria bacterium]|nr:hypothetical protein [Candidatus Kaiserbacteria bacterium]
MRAVFGVLAKKKFVSTLVLAISVAGLLPFVHAQFFADAVVVRTVNVFPSKISAEGWSNAETITFQNLDEYALLQEFNAINSATIDTSRAKLIDKNKLDQNEVDDILDNSDEATSTSSNETASTSADNTSVLNDDETVTDSADNSATSTQEVQFGLPSESSEEEVLNESEALPTQNTSTVPIVDEEPEQEQDTPASIDEATTTVMRKAESFFALAVSTVTALFDEASTTENEIDEVLEEVIDGGTDVPAPVSVETEEVDEEVGYASSTTIETVVEDEVESSASTTELQETVNEDLIQDEVVDDTEESVVEEVEEVEGIQEVTDCADDCVPYVISMSDFGFPLGENVEISGAQFRLSFAAKKKITREHIPQFSIRYSVDSGLTWSAGGVIIIDDEISNSINGGYFLFSLPEIDSQSALDSLKVELVYKDNPEVLDELYVESAWLEMFTLESSTEEATTDFLELLADDGYQDKVLSGDELVLPDGKELDFKFTDDNEDETLIIKTNESTYKGLSEVTTYFSVTNTTNDEEDFSVQTYFPNGVGEVTSLEVFNQNKPRQVVIPEYRPYVYHCEDGWDYVGQVVPATLKELSEQLSDTEEAEEVNDIDFSLPTTTIPELDGSLDDSSSNTTTTVLKHLPSISQLMQFSGTTSIENLEVSSSSDGVDSTVSSEDEVDQVPAYSCRNTNIVRECDELDGGNTACRMNQVKVQDHDVTKYAPGWDVVDIASGSVPKPSLLRRVAEFIGFGPDRKEVPDNFEVRVHTPEKHTIAPGETKYFRMDISFPPFTNGEYWIEAIGNSEYGLLDPFWSSQWSYRMPIQIDNSTGTNQTEYQVFMELDSSLSDFWSNVNSDGSDIRFVQEVAQSNLNSVIGETSDNEYNPSWTGRVALTIPASSLDETLTNFPVYVDLSTLGDDFWSNVESDGKDIRITTADGSTETAYDLVAINTGAKTGQLHFLAPSLSNASDNTFHIYYGNSGATAYAPGDTYGRENVWINDFIATYHLEEDSAGAGNSGLYVDSTSNSYDADDEITSTGKTGQLGLGQEIRARESVLDDYILYPSAVVNNQNELTMSFWINTSQTGDQAILNAGANNELIVFLQNTNLTLYNGGTSDTFALDSTVIGTGWKHMTVIRDANNDEWSLYIDGVADNQNPLSETMSAMSVPANCVLSGLEQDGSCLNSGAANQHYDGYLDEVRFSSTTRSSGWIAAEFDNQSAPTTFYSTSTNGIGQAPVTGWFSTSWDKRQLITIAGSNVVDDVTDFPVYVDLSMMGDDFFDDVASDGRDLRVTAWDGRTELPIEVVNIDTGAKTGQIYFKADLVSGVLDNEFYLYFDNSDAEFYDRADTYGSDNVWTNGFQAVYHLEENVAGTGNIDAYKDSTSNQYDGDDENNSSGKTGLFGAGQE